MTRISRIGTDFFWNADDTDFPDWNGFFYARADETYNNVVGQYSRYLGHVAKWVGGVFETPKTYDQVGVVYEAAPAAQQRDAVAFLQKQLFQTPEWLLDPKVLRLIRPDNGVAAVARLQGNILSSLLGGARLQRMIENEALDRNTYTVANLFEDLRTGIWSEIPARSPVSVHRRNLQKVFVEKMIDLYEPSPATEALRNTDVPSVALGTLRQLRTDLTAAYNDSNDAMSRSHYLDCLERIELALDPARRR